jgi:cytoskeleton protein RodZ
MSELMGADARPAEGASPGALLKRERERRSLTVQQAAEALHLDPWIVEAIEADRFHALGAPVYARGHLRKYAAQLGLSSEEVLQRYEALQDRPTVIDPIPAAMADPIRAPRRSLKGPAWTAIGLIVIACIAWGGYEAWMKHSQQQALAPALAPAVVAEPAAESSLEPRDAAPEAGLDTESAAAPEASTDKEASSEAVTAVAPEASPEAAVAAATESTPAAAPASAATDTTARVELRLDYTGDSWTEVVDSTGARLAYGAGSAGRTRTLSGVAPLQVTLGAVSAVKMQVNGEAVAVPRREGREYSRFTVDADGNLR